MRELLTAQELAELLGKHRETIYLMAQSGEIPAVKVAGRWRFDPEAVMEKLAAAVTR